MKVTQIYDLVNNATSQILGDDVVLQEDLSNIVDVGKEIIDNDNVDHYVKKLVNHIGKVVFVNRVYSGSAPSVLMDNWEFGSVVEKITAEMPTATESDSWKLENGVDYSPDIFYQPEVSAKFFNSKVTFEIPLSFTEKQVKESFSNASQLNGFLSMLATSVENSMTVKIDSLVMKTINNMIGETLVSDLDDGEGVVELTGTGVRAVNLLALYNSEYDDTLTKEKVLTSPEFIRYATYQIGLYSDRMKKISTLFNIGGKDRFTSSDRLKTVLLSDFGKASSIFLGADLNNSENVTLPTHEVVPYWQGSGTDYSFNQVSKIDVKTADGVDVQAEGIIGVMFDREALGVTNLDRRVTTNYNPKAEFYTNFYKFDAGYFNDMNENFVVFYVG